jgi:phytoene dehydrogenase-like protein
VIGNVAPAVLARLLGEPEPEPAPDGAQLKLNMLLSRLPRLRDAAVDPRDAFAGTFHVNESATQLATAYEDAAAGRIPSVPRASCTATRSPTRRSSAPSCGPRAPRR